VARCMNPVMNLRITITTTTTTTTTTNNNNINNDSMALVRERTIPNEGPPHVNEVSANFFR
jgi:hypothetical protein